MKKHTDKTMSAAGVAKMQAKIATMIETAPESKVRAYVDKQFPKMPEEMQQNLLADMLITSLRDEAAELDAIGLIQKEGLAAIEQLDAMKKEAEQQAEA
jgi:hypothetical protein